MILSDRDIRARLASGDLKIEPLLDEPAQLQPASVDLRLSREFIVYKPGEIACLDPREPASLSAAAERIVVREGEAFTLHPGDFALGSTIETVSTLLRPSTCPTRSSGIEMTSRAERPYGIARGSSYHEQSGPQVSRLRLDDSAR